MGKFSSSFFFLTGSLQIHCSRIFWWGTCLVAPSHPHPRSSLRQRARATKHSKTQIYEIPKAKVAADKE